jgi:hypothetical protein
MSHCEVTQLQSKLEVIEALQSLLDHTRTLDLGDVLQTEWQTIQNHLSAVLTPLGKEGWDYNLMEWPADVPLFNVSLNNNSLSLALSLDDLASLLSTLHLSWCIRIEQLNRIHNELMIGGDDLRDLLITQNKVYEWKA